MSGAGRYSQLVEAAKRRLRSLGVESKLEFAPEEGNFPFIFSYGSNSGGQQTGLVFLFAPENLFLNSEVLAFVIEHIRSSRNNGPRPLLLFGEGSIEVVQNILRTTGIARNAAVDTYGVTDQGYEMHWQLPG
ncbi:hypothetical protein IIA79_07740 [bacterium]|nr:hypothetical protein [bacterium]